MSGGVIPALGECRGECGGMRDAVVGSFEFFEGWVGVEVGVECVEELWRELWWWMLLLDEYVGIHLNFIVIIIVVFVVIIIRGIIIVIGGIWIQNVKETTAINAAVMFLDSTICSTGTSY